MGKITKILTETKPLTPEEIKEIKKRVYVEDERRFKE